MAAIDAAKAAEAMSKDPAAEKCAQFFFHEARHTARVVGIRGLAQERLEVSLDRVVKNAVLRTAALIGQGWAARASGLGEVGDGASPQQTRNAPTQIVCRDTPSGIAALSFNEAAESANSVGWRRSCPHAVL